MKKICTVLLCMACLSGAMCVVAASASTNEATNLCSKIPLKGHLGGVTTMSVPSNPTTPVEIYQNPADLQVRFGSNLGNLNVVVTNQWGFAVYQQTVNATAGSCLNIDTQSWAPGTYTIYILDGQGGGYEGQFVK